MRRFLLSAVICVTGVVSIARSAEPVAIMSPDIGTAKAVDHQTIELQTSFERPVMQTVAAASPAGVSGTATKGSLEPATRTEVVMVVEQQIRRLAINQVTARRVGGQKVPADKLAGELRRPTAVIVLRADQRLDPACEKLFKPETLILQLSASSAPPTIVPGQGPRIYPPQPLKPQFAPQPLTPR